MDLGPVIFDLIGTQLTQEERTLLKHPHIGGVILFARNYESPEQVIDLVSQIREERPKALVMVDQEGGRVQRFKEGFTRLPSLRLLGQLLDTNPDAADEVLNFAYQLGVVMASEIKSTGIDFSLAPVVDLDKGLNDVIGERAFHEKPDIVTELARAYIQGMEKAGMLSTIKHYPGHGSVTLDSHHDLPFDDRTEQEIANDLKPFKALVKEPNVKAVLPAHIVYKQLDENPACFSSYWLKEVLRAQLQFKGAIISDDLSMGAVTTMGSYTDRVQRALDAGCDLVLVCNDRGGVKEVLKSLEYELEDDSLSRIHELSSAQTPAYSDLSKNVIWQKAKEGLNKFEGLCACLNPTLV